MKKIIFVTLLMVIFLASSVALATEVDTGNLQRYKDSENPVVVDFYFPVGVAGDLAGVMNSMVEEFNSTQENIIVQPVYAGNYNQTMAKIQASMLGGTPPDVFVVEISELYTLLAIDGIISLDKYIEKEGGDAFTAQYFEALYGNAKADGKIWGHPFQRSTPILYWNKDKFSDHAAEFRVAGLDPTRAPETWDELEAAATILTDKKSGQYGVILPGGWNDWIFESFVYQNGGKLLSDDAKTSHFDSPEVLEALEFWYKLTNEIKVSPPLRPWNQTPTDFSSGNAAMMYYSTGGLPLVRKQSNFDFGVAFQPKNVQFGVPVGGGDFHISKNIPAQNQDAAWEFIKWMTTPENAAHWSIESGYICINKDGLELPKMKEYMSAFPQAQVAADQLNYSYPKIMAPNFQEIRKIFVANLDELMQGRQTPKETQDKLHNSIQKILDRY